MQRSVVKGVEIKTLLKSALTDQINDRSIFMRKLTEKDNDKINESPNTETTKGDNHQDAGANFTIIKTVHTKHT